MADQRALIIPESWAAAAKNDIAGLDCYQACYTILPIRHYEKLSPAKLKIAIDHCLKNTTVSSAVVFLPHCFSTGKFVDFWPCLYYLNKDRVIICSVYFASCWKECLKIFDVQDEKRTGNIKNFNVTCQYQPPYTHTLTHWENAGANAFHPGDFFKMDFLEQLSKVKGHWLYWGHADHEKLRGYEHLFARDLIRFRPKLPLRLTAWFSCATLDARYENNIALDWYLSGATQCLLAATCEMDTNQNQQLGLALLDACGKTFNLHIAALLQKVLLGNFREFNSLLLQYKLVGNPWVRL